MNNQRRKQIAKLIEELSAIQNKLADISSEAESVKDEEQEYFDAMPESLRGGEKGSMAEEAITHLENAVDLLSDVEGSIEEILSALEDAQA